MKKVKSNYLLSILLSLSLFLVGCGLNIDESVYEKAMQDGLENFSEEKFEKAEAYFEIALEEKKEDAESEAFLQQTQNYIDALNLFENEEFEEALVKLESILLISNGSSLIIEKAEQLKSKTKEAQTLLVSEREVDKAEEDRQRVKETKKSEEITGNQVEQKDNLTYEDFIGCYLYFESPDQTHSEMITTIGREYLTIGWWMSEYELYEILDKKVEGSILKIEYSMIPYPYEGDEYKEFGSIELIYAEENGEEKIIYDSGMEFHKKSYEEVQAFDYMIKDYLIEDMK